MPTQVGQQRQLPVGCGGTSKVGSPDVAAGVADIYAVGVGVAIRIGDSDRRRNAVNQRRVLEDGRRRPTDGATGLPDQGAGLGIDDVYGIAFAVVRAY